MKNDDVKDNLTDKPFIDEDNIKWVDSLPISHEGYPWDAEIFNNKKEVEEMKIYKYKDHFLGDVELTVSDPSSNHATSGGHGRYGNGYPYVRDSLGPYKHESITGYCNNGQGGNARSSHEYRLSTLKVGKINNLTTLGVYTFILNLLKLGDKSAYDVTKHIAKKFNLTEEEVMEEVNKLVQLDLIELIKI